MVALLLAELRCGSEPLPGLGPDGHEPAGLGLPQDGGALLGGLALLLAVPGSRVAAPRTLLHQLREAVLLKAA